MNRIIELENEIRKNQELYYNNEPVISDAEFDALCDELKELDPENPLLTTEVGSDHTEGFKKVNHKITMGSQSKANTETEMNEWCTTVDVNNIVGTYKMDGISVALYYTNGKLVSAVTRGDGTVGDDITKNVKKMNYVPKKLNENYTGTVRGEILLSRTNKEKYYSDKKNCRNTASGLAKRLDGVGCEHLDVVCYDAQYEIGSFNTQTDLIHFLENNGFKVATYKFFNKLTGKIAMEYMNSVFTEFDNLEYDIDGIVWKQNKIDIVDMTENVRPKTQIALKPAKVLKETTLIDIKWSVRNGTLTPVGIFEPVDMQGATIKQASLCNISNIEQMGLEIGHKIIVSRCGMIIPKIIKNVNTGKYAPGYEI